MENKFAILSHILPPSDSGQAVMLWRLLKDTGRNDYVLISDKNYDNISNFTQSTKKLEAKYYCLNQNNNLKLWEKGLLTLPFARNIYSFWWLSRQKANQIVKIIAKEKIRALIVCSGDITDVPAAYLATKGTKTRLVIYSFDDYVYQWVGIQRSLARIIASYIFPKSDNLIVPNEFLQKEYLSRYNRSSEIVRNPCLTNITRKTIDVFNPKEINIVYTGSIYHAQGDAFLNLMSALNLVKLPLKLHLFTGQSKEDLEKIGLKGEEIVVHKNLDQGEIIGIQNQADILFLPLAFNSPINEVILTSAPGKIGEYLTSGVPILVHAPKDSYISWYFRKEKAGIVVDDYSSRKLANAILKIIKQKKLIKLLIQNAYFAAKDFSIEKSSEAFNNVVEDKDRILLLTPAPPNTQSSGGLMLADLCKMIDDNKLYCFVAKDPLRRVRANYYPSIAKYLIVNRPVETTFGFSHFPLVQKFFYFTEKLKDIYIKKIIVKKAIAFGRRNKVNSVWTIIQGKTMISLAKPVSEALDVPLMTQVWDEPEWILSATNIDQITKREVLKKFDIDIQKSIICAAASQSMAENYQRKYKVKTAVFLGSLPEKMALPPAKNKNIGKIFKIGFAGQLYAREEFYSLINALKSTNWTIDKRSVKVYCLGKVNNLAIPLETNGRIIKLGQKTQKQTIEILSRMDILYLPYWFSADYEKMAKTSFPSKLTTYLASGRPVFFHGPSYSSPAKFIKKNRCGILCHSMEKQDIIRDIKSIFTDPKKYSSITERGNIAFRKYLTYMSLNKDLEKFLNTAEKGKK